MYILFLIFFHYGLSQDIEYSLPYIRTLLFIHSKYNSLHLPTPNSQPISLSPLPLGNYKSVLYVYESVSVLYIGSFVPYFIFFYLCHILDFTYEWCHMVFVFLFLTTSLSMIISSCIPVAANGIIMILYG